MGRFGAGKRKSTLVECAVSTLRSKDFFLYVRYKKIAPRQGHKRAIVAVAHTMLRAIYFMLKKMSRFAIWVPIITFLLIQTVSKTVMRRH